MNVEYIINNNYKIRKGFEDIVDQYNNVVKSRVMGIVDTYGELKVIDISDNHGYKTRYECGNKYFECGLNGSELFVDDVDYIN